MKKIFHSAFWKESRYKDIFLFRLWDNLRSSFWFVPGLMAFFSVALAIFMRVLDAMVDIREIWGLEWLALMDVSGARSILSLVASSAMSVTSVIFSITIVVLVMASDQFGPRLIRNFMRQSGTQIAIGTFIGSFIYCLVIMSTIPKVNELQSLPHLSVAIGCLLGVMSFIVLIGFIHHITIFIQAPRIIDDVTSELIDSMKRLFPDTPMDEAENMRQREDEANLHNNLKDNSQTILAEKSGYLQTVNLDEMLAMARHNNMIIQMEIRPGQFIIKNYPLARIYIADKLNELKTQPIHDLFHLGIERNSAQDAEFSVERLVEIAVRALSPGINDPFTAINCIDRLGEALAFLSSRRIPSKFIRDEEGKRRIITVPYTYDGIVNAAFNQIRQHARTNTAITIRLLETIKNLVDRDLPKIFRKALLRQAEIIYQASQEGLHCPSDRDDVKQLFGLLEEGVVNN